MVYQWQFGKYKASAQATGELFEKIEKRDGKITPESVLDAARPKKSIIHDDFEWDDPKAAEKYRLEQARKMISLLIVVSDGEAKAPVRAFVNTNPEPSKGVYMNIGNAMEDEDLKKVIIDNARKELEIFKSKYNRYVEFAKLISAIDEYLEETA